MKVNCSLLFLTLLIACEDPCWQAECFYSTEYRFNLIDTSGIDLIIGDRPEYSLNQLMIVDSLNNTYNIKIGDFGETSALIVTLSGEQIHYSLVLNGQVLDNFLVIYELRQEECCGLTPWIINVEFEKLRTELSKDDVGSMYIYPE